MSSRKPKPRRNVRAQPAPDPVKEFCTAAKREMTRYVTEEDAQQALVAYVQACSERIAMRGEPFVYDCERCNAYHIDPNVEGKRQFCRPARKVKHLYRTEVLAKRTVSWLAYIETTGKLFRAYECMSCRGWHLTSKMYLQV